MNRFVVAEPRRCTGCNTCMAACSAVHRAQGLQSLPRLTVMRTRDTTAPVVCRHCDDAPCARVCPVEAIRLVDGAVMLDEKRCVGCRMCALACPFGAITPSGTPVAGVAGLKIGLTARSAALDPLLAWDIGVRSVAVKCDLCEFQPQGPECVRVCPTDALWVVDEGEAARAGQAKRLAAAAAATNQPLVSGGDNS